MRRDDSQAKRMHINMCIKAMLEGPEAVGASYLGLALLDVLTSLAAVNADSAPIVKAINQALPGRSDG